MTPKLAIVSAIALIAPILLSAASCLAAPYDASYRPDRALAATLSGTTLPARALGAIRGGTFSFNHIWNNTQIPVTVTQNQTNGGVTQNRVFIYSNRATTSSPPVSVSQSVNGNGVAQNSTSILMISNN